MYSYKFDDTPVGKARVEGVDASYKDLVEVCSNIRKKGTSEALDLLTRAASGERPIRYRKYIATLAHRKELNGKPGRYPKKAARVVLGALTSALASAKAKSLSEDLVVVHAAANKKDTYPRLAPKGKRMRSYFETARVEIVVAERSPSKKPEQKAKPEAKKPEVKAEPKPVQKPEAKEQKAEPKAEPKPRPEATKPSAMKVAKAPKPKKGES